MDSLRNHKHAGAPPRVRHRLLTMGALVGLLFFTGCIIADIDDDDDFGGNDFVATQTFSIDAAVTSQVQLRLEAINGNVEILGRSGATGVRITGEKRVGSNSQRDAERRLDDLDIEVDERNDEIVIRTLQPQNTHGRNYTVNYTITLPVDLVVAATLINGNMTVADIDNDVSVHNVNGNVQLEAIVGSALVSLTNGNIDSEVVIPRTGVIEQTTTNGNITLAVPSTTSADFSARVTNGNIALEQLDLQEAVRTNQSLSGKLGDGDGTIELRTVNGNISMSGF